MPLCDLEPFVFEKQVMIKKVDSGAYELFYYAIGCGINYNHVKILIDQNQIASYEFIERWSESFPC